MITFQALQHSAHCYQKMPKCSKRLQWTKRKRVTAFFPKTYSSYKLQLSCLSIYNHIYSTEQLNKRKKTYQTHEYPLSKLQQAHAGSVRDSYLLGFINTLCSSKLLFTLSSTSLYPTTDAFYYCIKVLLNYCTNATFLLLLQIKTICRPVRSFLCDTGVTLDPPAFGSDAFF